MGPDARTGGTLTLVDKSLKSRQAWELVQDGGQCVGVVVGSVLVLNAYMAHHATRPAFLSDMFDFCQTVDNHTWLLAADWNDDPNTSHLALGLKGTGATVISPPPGIGSRWKSSHVIDYIMTNSDTSPASLEPLESRWSDHRAFKWTVERPFQVAQGPKFEIAPCNVYLPRDLENLSLWTQQLSSAWARSRDDFNNLLSNHLHELVPQAPDLPTKVDVTWAAVCDFLETFLQKEAATAHENGKTMRFFG